MVSQLLRCMTLLCLVALVSCAQQAAPAVPSEPPGPPDASVPTRAAAPTSVEATPTSEMLAVRATPKLEPTDSLPTASAGEDSPPCPDAPGPISAPIVFGAHNTLFFIQPDGSGLSQLLDIPTSYWTSDPAWSPDGTQLAYTLAVPANHPDIDWLKLVRICGLDRETGKGRVMLRGSAWDEMIQEATWTPDGHALLVTVEQLLFDADTAFAGSTKASAIYDLATGTRETLSTNTSTPVLSPDGQRLAYIRVDPATGDTVLEIGNSDGTGGQSIDAPEPAFSRTAAPRWSPDGSLVLFAASAPVEGSREGDPGMQWLLDRLTGVTVAEAHGPPTDLWTVDRDGKNLRQLTAKGYDDPRAAWSPDGRQLAYLAGNSAEGFHVLMLDTETMHERRLTDQGGHSGVTWAP